MAEHEEQLEAWKQKFKAEALRQISERERMLSDWQSKLEKKKTELDELQRSMEVGCMLSCRANRSGSFDLSTTTACIAESFCGQRKYPAAQREGCGRGQQKPGGEVSWCDNS